MSGFVAAAATKKVVSLARGINRVVMDTVARYTAELELIANQLMEIERAAVNLAL